MARLTDWRILLSAPSADLPAYSFLPQLRRVWSLDDGRVNHGQRAESGQSSELWRAGQSRDVTLSRHWWDVTRNWLQAVLPGPCVTVRPGLLCHDTGQWKHRTRGHGLSAQLYGWVKTKPELEIHPLILTKILNLFSSISIEAMYNVST